MEMLPIEFDLDIPALMAQLFDLSCPEAYPFWKWETQIRSILEVLNVDEIGALRTSLKSSSLHQEISSRSIFRKIRQSDQFYELDSALDEYERAYFCDFQNGVCLKCNRSLEFAPTSPLCSASFGISSKTNRSIADQETNGIIAEVNPDNANAAARIFISKVLIFFNLESQPFYLGEFRFETLINGSPVFIWEFENALFKETLAREILSIARNAGYKMLYFITMDRLIADLPRYFVDLIPFVVLPIPNDFSSNTLIADLSDGSYPSV